MSEKNVHQLQWKQKNQNPDPAIYVSRNAEIQSATTIGGIQTATGSAGLSNNPSSHTTTAGHGATASNNGRYPIIVSGNNQQIVTSPGALANSSSSTGLQQHFHHIQHFQQQQQQQQQQQHHHHHHQQNQHLELSKIMAINSGTLSRLELPPALGNHPVSSVITENVLSLIGMTGSGSAGGANRPSDGMKIPDEEKFRKVQSLVESGISDHAKQQILQILDRISTLKPVERLLLYLRMPGETPETDPLRQPQNPLGTRSEINHTINWVRSHLEHDPKVSIPKQDVYNDYLGYCERSDIKPLSTADFGKVMKQVFPEIRPRRLGTRGHSRYCYAAMRKTTKLSPPQLPILGGKTPETTASEIMESDAYSESWNTIRNWAEGLFNTKFENIKDLADHIGKGDYAASGTGNSRVLLQKKLLQRDPKEKRVYADSGPLKKRRRKKRKGSTSSESSTTAPSSSIGSLHEPSRSGDEILLGVHAIKQEILDSPNPQPRLPPAPSQMLLPHLPDTYDSQLHSHQMLPMNLATESDRSKGIGGALPLNSPAAKNLSKTIAELPPSVSLLPIDPQAVQLASVKEEIINDEYNPQNVICKKVRRAHLAKGILPTTNAPSSTITTAPSSGPLESQPIAPLVDLPSATVSTYSMGPPAQITTTAMESAKLISQVRARKQRLLQANADAYSQYDDQQQRQSPLVDNVEIAEDKDVLPENLGLPRERVISICNMDKHELDGYLNTNDEDNSQDQEAELLQYFQMGDAENNNNKAQQQQQQQHSQNNQQQQQLPHHQQHQLPLPQAQSNLDAPHPALPEFNSNSAFEVPNKKKSVGGAIGSFPKDRDDITQLRNYLHQNFNKDSNENAEALVEGTTANQKECIPLNNGNHYITPNIYNEGSASASLAIMSEKHLNDTASSSSILPMNAVHEPMSVTVSTVRHHNVANTHVDPSIISADNYAMIHNNVRATQKRKINLNAMVPGPSTTQRRKNYTFYPISPNSTNITPNNTSTVCGGTSCPSSSSSSMPTAGNKSLFASPRLTATSVRTKPTLHKQQSLPAADKDSILSANDPMIGANRNGCRNYSAMTSASAPPSPSILQDAMMFGKGYHPIATTNAMEDYNNLLLSNHDYQHNFTNSCSANKMLTGDQNSLECVLDQPPSHLMSESRSRSVPLHYRNSPAFNQTSNYAGFTSACSSAAQTPVPPHFTDFSDPSILDIFSDASQSHEATIKIEDTTSGLLTGTVSSILPPDYSRLPNNFGGIVSRSVPSTPLPLQNMTDPFLGGKKHQQQQQHDAFSVQSKYSTKMYDISKSMPTTPITSNTATPSFRYSPEFNRDFLINGNTVESTPAYSRAPSVAAAVTPNLSDSLLDDAREGGSNSLTDGMDDLGGFGEVSESIIEADILQMNNL